MHSLVVCAFVSIAAYFAVRLVMVIVEPDLGW
jgi:hypothetical protein